MAQTLVDLLRHGEPVGGLKYRGQRDDPLSEHGWAQMRATVGERCPWDVVVSSPLRRCVEFARDLAQRHGLALRVDDDLKEVGFGAWEGRSRVELEASRPLEVAQFYRNPVRFRPRDAEPLEVFRARAERGWRRLLQSSPGHVLVVCHAGIIRMLMAGVLGMPLEHLYRIQVPYAGLTRLAHTPGGETRLLLHAATVLPPS